MSQIAIKTKTINVDGNPVEMGWTCFCHLKQEWLENWGGPQIDDELIEAEVYDTKLTGGTFRDVLEVLKKRFNWEY